MTMATDHWNPEQYAKFRGERMQPFFDLLALIRSRPEMRVIDLGCGNGELTALLAEQLPGAVVEGVDSSAAMLAQAEGRRSARVSFRLQNLAKIADFGAYDLIFSNAVLQWVPENERILTRMLTTLRPGAQIAIQVPRNEGHISHASAAELARIEPFATYLNGYVRESHVLTLERYSELLYEHGLREHTCIEKIFGHELARSTDVVEWVKGTMLSAYLGRLNAAQQVEFLSAYESRLIAAIGEQAPYFYPFRRMLFWGMKGE